jgi:hypothetical protein
LFPVVHMATKNKSKVAKKALKKPVQKKQAARKPAEKKAKPVKKPVVIAGKKLKCCNHCPDFEYCDDKSTCCDYCDFYLNGKCMYGKKKGIPSVNQEIELPDYRGDDYGIDDYEAYEPVYE